MPLESRGVASSSLLSRRGLVAFAHGCGAEREQIAVAVADAVAALLAGTPDSGGAQAGGVSPPFTVCAHSWFEVWGGVWARGGGGVGWGEREG